MNWSIISLESFSDTGIVISVQWKCSNEQVVRTGTSILAEPTDNVIEYDLLTEQDVLNWVWIDGGVDKTLVEESVAQEFNNKLNPTIVQKQPHWVK